MTMFPTVKQHRELFHGKATDINLTLTIEGPDAKKAYNKLKQHPKTIKKLWYVHDIENLIGQPIENPIGYLDIEMYSSNITKTLTTITSFNNDSHPNNITLIRGRYDDAFESEETNRKANTLINNLIIEQYQNNYKGQLFKTNDKEHPFVSDINDYLATKDTTYALYVERVMDLLSYTRYGKDKKERICLCPIDRHFMVASYAKTQEKAHIKGTATNQNLTVILESNFPHEVLDYLKKFPEQLIDANFKRPLNSIKTAEIIVNLHTENLEETLIMLTNCPNSVIMDVYYNNLYDDKRHMIIAQTLLNQFKEQHPKNTFVVRQKETNSQKTYDTFPDDINPQTIGHIEQTASALYYRTIDQKTTLIFAKEKETAHGNC